MADNNGLIIQFDDDDVSPASYPIGTNDSLPGRISSLTQQAAALQQSNATNTSNAVRLAEIEKLKREIAQHEAAAAAAAKRAKATAPEKSAMPPAVQGQVPKVFNVALQHPRPMTVGQPFRQRQGSGHQPPRLAGLHPPAGAKPVANASDVQSKTTAVIQNNGPSGKGGPETAKAAAAQKPLGNAAHFKAGLAMLLNKGSTTADKAAPSRGSSSRAPSTENTAAHEANAFLDNLDLQSNPAAKSGPVKKPAPPPEPALQSNLGHGSYPNYPGQMPFMSQGPVFPFQTGVYGTALPMPYGHFGGMPYQGMQNFPQRPALPQLPQQQQQNTKPAVSSPARKRTIVQSARAEMDKVNNKPPEGDPPGFMPPLPPSLLSDTPKESPSVDTDSNSLAQKRSSDSTHKTPLARGPRSRGDDSRTPRTSTRMDSDKKTSDARVSRFKQPAQPRSKPSDKKEDTPQGRSRSGAKTGITRPATRSSKGLSSAGSELAADAKGSEQRDQSEIKAPTNGSKKTSLGEDSSTVKGDTAELSLATTEEMHSSSTSTESAETELSAQPVDAESLPGCLEEYRSVLKQKEALLLRRKVLDAVYAKARDQFSALKGKETRLSKRLGKHAEDAALKIFSSDDITNNALSTTEGATNPLEELARERTDAMLQRRKRHFDQSLTALEAQNLPTQWLLERKAAEAAVSPPQKPLIADSALPESPHSPLTDGQQSQRKRKYRERLRAAVEDAEPSQSGPLLADLRKTLLEKKTASGTGDANTVTAPEQEVQGPSTEPAISKPQVEGPMQTPETDKVAKSTTPQDRIKDNAAAKQLRKPAHSRDSTKDTSARSTGGKDPSSREFGSSEKPRARTRSRRSLSRSRSRDRRRSRDRGRDRSRSPYLKRRRRSSRSPADRRRSSRDVRHRSDYGRSRCSRSLKKDHSRSPRRGQSEEKGKDPAHKIRGPKNLHTPGPPPLKRPEHWTQHDKLPATPAGKSSPKPGSSVSPTARSAADSSSLAADLVSKLTGLLTKNDPLSSEPIAPLEHRVALALAAAVQKLQREHKMPKGGSIKDIRAKSLRIAMYKTLTGLLPAGESAYTRDEVAGEVTRLLGEQLVSQKLVIKLVPPAQPEDEPKTLEGPKIPKSPGKAASLQEAVAADPGESEASASKTAKTNSAGSAPTVTAVLAEKPSAVPSPAAKAPIPAFPPPATAQIGEAIGEKQVAGIELKKAAEKESPKPDAAVSKEPAGGKQPVQEAAKAQKTRSPDTSPTASLASGAVASFGTHVSAAKDSGKQTSSGAVTGGLTLQTPQSKVTPGAKPATAPDSFIMLPPTAQKRESSPSITSRDPRTPPLGYAARMRIAGVAGNSNLPVPAGVDANATPAIINNNSDPNAPTPAVQNRRLVWPDTPEVRQADNATGTAAGASSSQPAGPSTPEPAPPSEPARLSIGPEIINQAGDVNSSLWVSCFATLAQSGKLSLERWEVETVESQATPGADPSQDGSAEPYESPLLDFKSYRLCPTYKSVSKLPISSRTFAHRIEPNWPFCPFELRGSCRDTTCPFQMNVDYTLNNLDVLSNVSAMSKRAGAKTSLPPVAQASDSSSLELHCQRLLKGSQPQILIQPEVTAGLKSNKARISQDKIQDACINGDVPQYSGFYDYKPQQAFKSILLSSVVLPEPPFEGGVLVGVDGGNTPLQAYKQVIQKTAGVQDRYFAPNSKSLSEAAATTPDSDDKWSKGYEARLIADPADEEVWLSYALEAFNRSPTKQGDYVQALKLLARALDKFPKSAAVWRIYIHFYAIHVGPQPDSDLGSILEAALRYQPDCYHLWLVCLAKTKKAEDRLILLQKGIVAFGTKQEGLAPEAVDSRVSCLLDLWLRFCSLMAEAFESRIPGWLGLLVADSSEALPTSIEGLSLEKLAVQRLRSALAGHPLHQYIMWSTAAYLAAYSKVPVHYLHSLGYPAEPVPLEFDKPTAASVNSKVHEVLSMACGPAYGCLSLRAASEVSSGRPIGSMADAKAVQLMADCLAKWQIKTGTTAILSSFGHKMGPLIDFQPLILCSYRAAEYVRLNASKEERQAVLDAYTESNQLLSFILTNKGDGLVEAILPEQPKQQGAGNLQASKSGLSSKLMHTTTRAGNNAKGEMTAQKMVAKWPWMKELYNCFSKDKPAFQAKMKTLAPESKTRFKAFCLKVKEQKAANSAAKQAGRAGSPSNRLSPADAALKILKDTEEALSSVPGALRSVSDKGGCRLSPSIVLALALKVFAASGGKAELAAPVLAASVLSPPDESKPGPSKRKAEESPSEKAPDKKPRTEAGADGKAPDSELPSPVSDTTVGELSSPQARLAEAVKDKKLLDSDYVRGLFKAILDPSEGGAQSEDGEIADENATDISVAEPLMHSWLWMNVATYELLSGRTNLAVPALEKAIDLSHGRQQEQLERDQIELMSIFLSSHSVAPYKDGQDQLSLLWKMMSHIQHVLQRCKAAWTKKPLEQPVLEFRDRQLGKVMTPPASMQADSFVAQLLPVLPALSQREIAVITEMVISKLPTSTAAARLAVEALALHSASEQWVSWGAPLAVQALTSSLPVPASELWLQTIEAIERHAKAAAHELSSVAIERCPASKALADKHLNLCAFIGAHAKSEAESRLTARFPGL